MKNYPIVLCFLLAGTFSLCGMEQVSVVVPVEQAPLGSFVQNVSEARDIIQMKAAFQDAASCAHHAIRNGLLIAAAVRGNTQEPLARMVNLDEVEHRIQQSCRAITDYVPGASASDGNWVSNEIGDAQATDEDRAHFNNFLTSVRQANRVQDQAISVVVYPGLLLPPALTDNRLKVRFLERTLLEAQFANLLTEAGLTQADFQAIRAEEERKNKRIKIMTFLEGYLPTDRFEHMVNAIAGREDFEVMIELAKHDHRENQLNQGFKNLQAKVQNYRRALQNPAGAQPEDFVDVVVAYTDEGGFPAPVKSKFFVARAYRSLSRSLGWPPATKLDMYRKQSDRKHWITLSLLLQEIIRSATWLLIPWVLTVLTTLR